MFLAKVNGIGEEFSVQKTVSVVQLHPRQDGLIYVYTNSVIDCV